MVGSDFVEETVRRRCFCSECNKVLKPGDKALVSIRKGRVRKRVCSEDCRQEFDARFWLALAEEKGGR